MAAIQPTDEGRRAAAGTLGLRPDRRVPHLVLLAVMSFKHEALAFNLFDAPGQQDFNEDTYRTLTAVDSTVMVLDALPSQAHGSTSSEPQPVKSS